VPRMRASRRAFVRRDRARSRELGPASSGRGLRGPPHEDRSQLIRSATAWDRAVTVSINVQRDRSGQGTRAAASRGVHAVDLETIADQCRARYSDGRVPGAPPLRGRRPIVRVSVEPDAMPRSKLVISSSGCARCRAARRGGRCP
jgi:hypothetical protein